MLNYAQQFYNNFMICQGQYNGLLRPCHLASSIRLAVLSFDLSPQRIDCFAQCCILRQKASGIQRRDSSAMGVSIIEATFKFILSDTKQGHSIIFPEFLRGSIFRGCFRVHKANVSSTFYTTPI